MYENPATVVSVPVTGLDNKTYIEYRAVSEGYGIIAMGSRGFAEQAALEWNRKRERANALEASRNE